MPPTEFHKVKNLVLGHLLTSLDSTSLSLTLRNDEGDNFPDSSSKFWISVRQEIMECNDRSGDVLFISERGVQDTNPAAHPFGSAVQILITAETITELQDAINAIEDGGGGGGSGNVSAPNPVNDLAIAIFDGTTGELIKDSSIIINDSMGYMTGITKMDINGGYIDGSTGITIGGDLGDGGISIKNYMLVGDTTGSGGTIALTRDGLSSSSSITFLTNLDPRWLITMVGDETGLDSGSDFTIIASDDTGGANNVIIIPRLNDQAISINRPINVLGFYNGGGTTIGPGIIGSYQIAAGDSTTEGAIFLNKDITGTSVIAFFAADNNRWINAITNDESGLDSGSDWILNAYDDTGAYQTVITIPRKFDETIIINRSVNITGDLTANNLSGINTGDQTSFDGGSP